jgi:hypothetical protein
MNKQNNFYKKLSERNGMIHNIISFAKLDLVYKSVTLPSLFEIEKEADRLIKEKV